MRIAWFALALMPATTAACGGIDKVSSSSGPSTCGHGPNVVLTASSVVLAPSEVAETVDGFSGFVELSPPLATSDGKTILVTWTAVDASGVAKGHVVVAHLGPGEVVGTSAPVDAPTRGVAAFDGADFLVAGPAGGPPPIPDAPMSLQLERVALDGSVAGAPQTVDTVPGPAFVSSAVWTSRGLAIAWGASGASSSPPKPQTAVQLFDRDGRLIAGVTLDAAVPDPNTGLLGFAPAAVALFQGQLVVANAHAVSTLDWLGGPAQTSQTKFTVSVPEKGGFPTLFETGGQLRIWGFGESPGQDVFAGAPGESFTQVGSIDPSAVTQESDGCGGAVTLSNRDTALSVVSDTAPGRVVRLGTTLQIGDTVAAMTTTPSGFAVIWMAEDGMHLSTLAWQ